MIKGKWKSIRKTFKRILAGLCFIWLMYFIFCLPDKPFNKPTSTVLLSSEGRLMGARIADDGQWRFSASEELPYRFERCLLEFEDRGFYKHIGVSLKAIARAVDQNFRNGRIVSGGSTITMQVARMMRERKGRSLSAKFIEMTMALRLEAAYTKKEILVMYASNAPFGNNVVGLEAASWRYFSRPSNKLSWAESATLAVLPNAPGLLYPGKNHELLLAKRNRLLNRLKAEGIIDSMTCSLALMEPLPDKPLPLPNTAPHLIDKLVRDGKKGQTVWSTVGDDLQRKLNAIAENYMRNMADRKIYNASILVSSLKTGQVLSYIGNVKGVDPKSNGSSVDCIQARRSTGSVLKPILYAKSMEEGLTTPSGLLFDLPSYFGGFSPKNFNYRYEGVVPADEALCKSLNVPFVRLLEAYGYEKFHYDLKQMGYNSLDKPAGHYGLSLILGGAEIKSWELNQMYSMMGGVLTGKSYEGLTYDKKDSLRMIVPRFSKACVYSTFEAMTALGRPDEDGNWMLFDNQRKVAWKTGTSFGFRDAWALGVTPDYVVTVWVGNADGEGRPGLTGIKAAAPLMFDVLRTLSVKTSWFKSPLSDMIQLEICQESGYRAGPDCPKKIKTLVPYTCLEKVSCPYHKVIFTDPSRKFRVDCDCEEPGKMVRTSWFALSPAAEKFYKTSHPEYQSMPPFRSDCRSGTESVITIIYPRHGSRISIPLEIDGNKGSALFEVAHRLNGSGVMWHLDDTYIGQTKDIHQMKFNPTIGKHKLLCMDDNGNSQMIEFEVMDSKINESR